MEYKIWSIKNMEYRKYGVWKIWSIENMEYGKYGV